MFFPSIFCRFKQCDSICLLSSIIYIYICYLVIILLFRLTQVITAKVELCILTSGGSIQVVDLQKLH